MQRRYPTDFDLLVSGIGIGVSIGALIVMFVLLMWYDLFLLLKYFYLAAILSLYAGTIVTALGKGKTSKIMPFLRGIPLGSFSTIFIFAPFDWDKFIKLLLGL